ncbi:hypothetical protein [uncultured Victivallis sp.]|uniref:hypothetical protein n=1 Tax=uncultured Victivallis sp. TaxID=354118 RepID=UPI0025EE3397|nr:hypothetical protein [uncultured Victivallis sp.]
MQPRHVSAGGKKSRKRGKHRGHRAASKHKIVPAGKIAGNGPQIVEAGNASNDQPDTESRARSGNAAIFDGIAPELIALGEQEAARRGVTLPELIAEYLRTFTPERQEYSGCLRNLLARNSEALKKSDEEIRGYTRKEIPVPAHCSQDNTLIVRRMCILQGMEYCPPWRFKAILFNLHTPLSEGEKELINILSALWPWQEE